MGNRGTGAQHLVPRRRYGSWLVAVSLTVALTGAAAAAFPSRTTSRVPTKLVLEGGLLARLRILAAGLHNEIVLCLTGVVEGGTATATGFLMPEPHRSEAEGASFGSCPGAPLALWHNHPPESSRLRPDGLTGTRGDPAASPRDFCALSEADIHTAYRAAVPFTVVAVDAGTWCWWTRDQIRRLAGRRALRGDPVPGQIESIRPY